MSDARKKGGIKKADETRKADETKIADETKKAIEPKRAVEHFPALDELLCFSLYSASHAFNQLYRPVLDEIGLTYPQYLVLVVLWATDDQTVRDLGRALHLDSSTLTPLLKRLEVAGYVSRNRNPDDERQVRVRLTSEGNALRERARAVPNCAENAVTLPIETIKRLLADVSSLRDMLVARSS